jgi:hypothetical protein
MLCLTEIIRLNDPSMQCLYRAVEDARALTELNVAAWKLPRVLAVDIVEYVVGSKYSCSVTRMLSRRSPQPCEGEVMLGGRRASAGSRCGGPPAGCLRPLKS